MLHISFRSTAALRRPEGPREIRLIPVRSQPILQLDDATVVKGGRAVIDAISLTIEEGEHTVVLGPNGAGKSVLLRLLTHQERPLAREEGPAPVRVLGQDIWNISELQSQLGVVSADLHHRFVNGNNEGLITAEAAVLSGFLVSYGILRYGEVTDDMRRRTAEALDMMGVSHLATRRLNEMSSGEARRVMLARALVTTPRALVLDEPTTGLDLVARHDFLDRVRRIARNGTTLILITHHVEEVVPEIERVVLLSRGRIAAHGPKASMLTGEHLSRVFDAPVQIDQVGGFYFARPDSPGSFAPPDPPTPSLAGDPEAPLRSGEARRWRALD
jgi:iron complex transport system ATP-binding protein